MREREKKKNRSVQADSQGHVSHYHELISCVLPVGRSFLTESIVVSVSICEIGYTVSQETIHGFQQIRCGEPTTTTTVRAMKKNQTLLEINAAIAAMLDSN